jgi:hypothetical protein
MILNLAISEKILEIWQLWVIFSQKKPFVWFTAPYFFVDFTTKETAVTGGFPNKCQLLTNYHYISCYDRWMLQHEMWKAYKKCGKQHTFHLESNSQNGLRRKFCPCHSVEGKCKLHLVKIQRVINLVSQICYVSFFISQFKWCAQDYRKENQLWYKEAEEVPPSSKHSILLVA